MGRVQTIVLAPDLQHVIVTVRMNREAERLLTDRAQFWVVKPRIFAGSISGLSTLLSGSYIELLPSAQGGAAKRHFTGARRPAGAAVGNSRPYFLLQASRIGSISLGSPIFYRDLSVGEVLGWDIGDMADNVTIHAFVRTPYDKYVHDGTRFWNASGLSVKLGAGGVQVQVEVAESNSPGRNRFRDPERPPGVRRRVPTSRAFRCTPIGRMRTEPNSNAGCLSQPTSRDRSPGWRRDRRSRSRA